VNHATTPRLELVARREGEHVLLLAPRPGRFQGALAPGSVLVEGQLAGRLVSLGRALGLYVPAGAEGRHVGPAPEWMRQPVSRGTVLYRLEPLGQTVADPTKASGAQAAAASSGELAVRAPHAGRFWSRPAPDEPTFVSPGDVLEAGRPLGLIEVMKTFSQVVYRPGGELPARARVRALLVGDGDEVDERAALIALERAD
jgi:acetyl-CoA carboxylase biotin carboxyl carrier protein